MVGLVPSHKLKPSDLIGVNKDSYLILDTLPAGENGKLAFVQLQISDRQTHVLLRVRLTSQSNGGRREANRLIY